MELKPWTGIRSVLPFSLLFVFPVMGAALIEAKGPWLWVTPFFALAFLPIVDLIVDKWHPSEAARLIVGPRSEKFAIALLWLYVPIQVVLQIWAMSRSPEFGEMGTGFFVGLILSFGIISGAIGITISHEMVHRRDQWSIWSGLVLLSSVCYGQFAVEHVLGHHTHVGTDNDPASARRGENSWGFAFRSIVYGFVSAWKIEGTRLRRLGASNGWSWKNRILHSIALSAAFASIAFWAGGRWGLVFFFGQSLVAVLLLEIINYVEHYGLRRRILENGKPEPVQLWHSWDSRSLVSGWFIIHLSRHADHHKYPSRQYTKLEGSRVSPLLPVGYPASLLLATIPPLWYRVIHPHLDKFLLELEESR